jgi:prolipoprotein diacylglyceryltransferase
MAQLVIGPLAFFGARLFSMASEGTGLLEWGAVRSSGGELALVLAAPSAAWLVRLPVGRYVDVLAPSVTLALAVGRLGCLAQGCCFGTRSNLPWALAFPRGSPAYVAQLAEGVIPATAAESLPVHPLQIYFAASAIAVTAVLLWRARRKRFDGEVALWLVVLSSGSKFLLEALRGRGIHVPEPDLQTIPLAMLVLAATALGGIHLLTSAGVRAARPARGE